MNAKTQPNKGQVLARGKTKTLYETDDPGLLIMEFRDDTTAFDGGKKEQLEDKGAVNNAFNAHIMALLAGQGVEVHWLEQLDACSSLVRRLDMIPLEAVVRNTATGSLCRRLGVEEGLALEPPVFEFFYKDDERGDPMVNESHAVTFGWATPEQMQRMREMSLAVNGILGPEFDRAGLHLVDYKLEFGLDGQTMVLGDEFTPDGARIWHRGSGKKMDKDRFRQGLGEVVESYRQVAEMLAVKNQSS